MLYKLFIHCDFFAQIFFCQILPEEPLVLVPDEPFGASLNFGTGGLRLAEVLFSEV